MPTPHQARDRSAWKLDEARAFEHTHQEWLRRAEEAEDPDERRVLLAFAAIAERQVSHARELKRAYERVAEGMEPFEDA